MTHINARTIQKSFASGLLTLALSALFLTPPANASDSLQQSATFTVLAGYEDPTRNGLEIEAYMPENITIKVDDTIQWRFTEFEPHTVTFLSGAERPEEFIELPDGRLGSNPVAAFPSEGSVYSGTGFFNSGIVNTLPGNDLTYSLTFDTVGTFQYVCLIHPLQVGTVTVLPETAPPIFPPEIVVGNAEAERDLLIAEINAANQQANPDNPVDRGDGTREHEVLAGISTQKVDLMYFDQPELRIAQGDTVTWSWEATGAPHNVVFLLEGQDPPPFIIPEPQDAGPPNLVLNSVVLEPAGEEVYDPDEFFNSGLRFNPNVPPPPGFATGATYSLTFNEQGTFTYLCTLHVDQGMIGTIEVGRPRPTPPIVGDASPSTAVMATAGFLGMALAASGLLVLRRRKRSEVSF